MAQYKSGDPGVPPFVVENGSQTVVIPGVDARTDIPFSADRPPYFREQETGPTYEVASAPQYTGGDTVVTLTGAWQGDSGEIDGLFHVDFSANMGYPLFYSGDIDIPDILRRWVVDLDDDVNEIVNSPDFLRADDLARNGGTVPEVDQVNRWGNVQVFNNPGEFLKFNPLSGTEVRLESRPVTDLTYNLNWPESTTHVLSHRVAGGTTEENIRGFVFTMFSSGNLLSMTSSGAAMGEPDGGFMGAGTLNAEALYEDGNRVVTDYVFDAAIDGEIDTDYYDGLIGDREIKVPDGEEEADEEVEVTESVEVSRDEWCDEAECYVRRTETQEQTVYTTVDVLDEAGVKVGEKRVPKTETRKVTRPKFRTEIEPGRHEPARRFVDNFDDLDPREFAKKWRASRKLPAFERLEQALDQDKRPSLGSMLQAVLETVEVQAVHIAKLEERISDLETPAD